MKKTYLITGSIFVTDRIDAETEEEAKKLFKKYNSLHPAPFSIFPEIKTCVEDNEKQIINDVIKWVMS